MKILEGDSTINILWQDRKRHLGMPISFTQYAIAQKDGVWCKLFCQEGWISTTLEEIHLYRIDDISVFQSVGGKILGVGNVVVHCDDASCNTIVLKNIKDPYKVRKMLNDLVEKERKNKRILYGEMA